MTNEEILKECNKIFIQELGNPAIVLSNATTAVDIDEWDSLNHIQIIVAIEKHFNIRFTSNDVQRFKSVGNLCEAISKKIR